MRSIARFLAARYSTGTVSLLLYIHVVAVVVVVVAVVNKVLQTQYVCDGRLFVCPSGCQPLGLLTAAN